VGLSNTIKINYFGLDQNLLNNILNDDKFKNIFFSVLYGGNSLIGNSYLSNNSKLVKLLQENNFETMTPAMSVLDALINFDWNKLIKSGVIYKNNDSNFMAFGTILLPN